MSEEIAKNTIEDASTKSEEPPRNLVEGNQSAPRKHWIWPTVASVLAAIALTIVIYPMPAPARTYVALSAAAGALVLGGLVTLIVLIPAAGSNPDVKTEFYSARAAYLCVKAGLVLFGVVAIGAVVARVMSTVGRH